MKGCAATLLEAEAIAAAVRSVLHEEKGITYTTFEAEARACGRKELLGEWK
jgi:hypothetical protein